MELRSCTHLHFIQAIKGGFVTKISNVTHGRPVLTFKNVKDIYEVVDVKNHDLLPTLEPKDESESWSFDGDMTGVKSPRLHTVERRTVKREPETFDLCCNGGDNGINDDLADLEFSDMTLKQIKERCKAKKRKRSECVKLSKEAAETSSCMKQDFANSKTEEEDFDFKESLGSWKSKLSKNTKAKKKRMRNHASASSQSSTSIVISEQFPIDKVLPQSSGDLWLVNNIKVEFPEPDCSDRQHVMCVGGDSSLPCLEPKGSCGMLTSELCERANECVSETQVSISSTEEPQYCVTNELCYEYVKPADPKSSLPCLEPKGSCGTSELCERANECVSETQVSISSTEEPQYCVTNELCYEYVKPADPKSSLPCLEPKGSCGTSELCERANECVSETQVSISLTKEPQYCVTNELCYEYVKPADPKSSLPCREPKGSCGMVTSELCGRGDECVLETQVSISSTEELQYCVTNELCYEYMKPEDPKFHQIVRASGGNSMEVESFPCHGPEGCCGMVTSELCERANVCVSEESISLTEEPEYCVTNEACLEFMEPADLKSIQIVRTSGGDSVDLDNTETTSHECADLPVPESEKKGYAHPVPHDISPKTISSSIDHSSYISGITQTSSMNENNDIKVQVPHMTIQKSTQGMELGYGGDAYVFEDDIAADLPSNPEANVISSSAGDSSLSPDICMDSVEDDSPTSEEKQPQKSACANAEINTSAGIHPCYATDELMTSVDFESCHHSKLQHPPERLPANRKAISPTSQERLLKAMDSLELQDNDYHNCRERLYFGKNKIGRVEGPDLIRGAEFGINPQKITRKRKNDKRGTPPKGVHKVPNLSGAVPRFSTGCKSIQSCSQSAIEFSQRQMNDFEYLSMKLTKELKSMKDILEERLLPEVCPASSFKYNVDRTRRAIKNATRLEESTGRWLSMMARDCNRFCKIMRMAEKGSGSSGNVAQKERKESTLADEAGGILVDQYQRLIETGSASSGNVVHKEKKKITFADEAGGELCHVRFFEGDIESLLESNTENQELLVN